MRTILTREEVIEDYNRLVKEYRKKSISNKVEYTEMIEIKNPEDMTDGEISVAVDKLQRFLGYTPQKSWFDKLLS